MRLHSQPRAKVNTAGIITTVAGNGNRGFSQDGTPAVNAAFSEPFAIAVDTAGNLYIAERSGRLVRRVGTDQILATVAGNREMAFAGDGGPAVRASLFEPQSLAVDSAGNVYVADTPAKRVRRVGGDGVITTFAGNGLGGYGGDGHPATSATVSYPTGTAMDPGGVLYIADTYNHVIRKVGRDGVMSTLAGTGVYGYGGDGTLATKAQLARPAQLALDASGNLYVADSNNNRVRRIAPSGFISTIAGNGRADFCGDGGWPPRRASTSPAGVVVNRTGNVYIADSFNSLVRKVSADGRITTIAGNRSLSSSGDGGPATQASVANPGQLALDDEGNLYIAEYQGHRIRRVAANGIITTVAGNGVAGIPPEGARATSTSIAFPEGVAIDGWHNLYISDRGSNRVRRVGTDGTIVTVAGTRSAGGLGDGGLSVYSTRSGSPPGVPGQPRQCAARGRGQ